MEGQRWRRLVGALAGAPDAAPVVASPVVACEVLPRCSGCSRDSRRRSERPADRRVHRANARSCRLVRYRLLLHSVESVRRRGLGTCPRWTGEHTSRRALAWTWDERELELPSWFVRRGTRVVGREIDACWSKRRTGSDRTLAQRSGRNGKSVIGARGWNRRGDPCGSERRRYWEGRDERATLPSRRSGHTAVHSYCATVGSCVERRTAGSRLLQTQSTKEGRTWSGARTRASRRTMTLCPPGRRRETTEPVCRGSRVVVPWLHHLDQTLWGSQMRSSPSYPPSAHPPSHSSRS